MSAGPVAEKRQQERGKPVEAEAVAPVVVRDTVRDCKERGVQIGDAGAAATRVAAALAERAGLGAPPPRLPDPEAVAEVASLAQRLLFPEVWTGEPPTVALLVDGARRLHDLIEDLLFTERLARPQRDSLQPAPLETPCEAHETLARCWAHETALSVLDLLPSLRERMETDLAAAVDGDPAARSRAEVILCYPGFHAIATHRLAHQLWLAGGHLTARLMAEQAHRRTGIDLHPGAVIGPSFFIDHGTGVVVGETAILGARVRLYQGVTVGARSVARVHDGKPGPKRHPTLEDDVVVYANATLLGGDTVIGRGAIIGGNTWVTTSVPAGARLRLDVGARVAEAVVMLPDGAQPV